MPHRLLPACTLALLLFLNFYVFGESTPSHWKGYAVLGNGNICAVYSDDARIIAKNNGDAGIHHLYYKNYTADYVRSSTFQLLSPSTIDKPPVWDSTGMNNFFTAQTIKTYEDRCQSNVTCFVSEKDIIVQQLTGKNLPKSCQYLYQLKLRDVFISDDTTKINFRMVAGNSAIIGWSNGTYLVVSAGKNSELKLNNAIISINGDIANNKKVEVRIALANSAKAAITLLKLSGDHNLEKESFIYWNKWINTKSIKGDSHAKNDTELIRYFNRTLYAVKSACLNGQIPADMTGQFVTNNMPQLYPRDAMKCARVFLKTGHIQEAKDIITFWVNSSIPKKSKGEFYARYDAKAKAVDAGSGARFDEPEWDANGYMIQLLKMYHDIKHEWLAPKEYVYELADFLISKIDNDGLLYEGGIVEWTAYLPTTNMVCSAALETASQFANTLGDVANSIKYKAGARTISESLAKTFDKKDSALKAIRFHGNKSADNRSITSESQSRLFMWDGTMQFGVLWGYPEDAMLRSTIDFYSRNLIKNGGGMQYFQALDPGLAGYGGDCFFFNTASFSQYFSLTKQKEKAYPLINWMCSNSNIYGLMPERIYLNQTDCSDASPLSWCNAEFALAVQEYLNISGMQK
jgi:GH15 family glucan-1,4-alpha-glucosidase